MKRSHVFFCSFLFISFSHFSHALPQYINEFHYDNTGADQFEYVEIAGVAGSDLSGWHLDFYNGTNGRVYASWSLSGLIDDEGAGFGALSFSGSAGLQNGPNDAIALVDSFGALRQFISYEGSLVGTEGAANGIASQNIGLTENGSTPVGYSLQLSGVATDSEGFSWQSGVSSFGVLNADQAYQTAQQTAAVVQSVNEPQQFALMALALFGLCCRRQRFGVSGLKA